MTTDWLSDVEREISKLEVMARDDPRGHLQRMLSVPKRGSYAAAPTTVEANKHLRELARRLTVLARG